jgi:hypothetical protein
VVLPVAILPDFFVVLLRWVLVGVYGQRDGRVLCCRLAVSAFDRPFDVLRVDHGEISGFPDLLFSEAWCCVR